MESLLALVTFVIVTGLVGLFTWRATRQADHQTSSGYFLAGRSLGAGVIAGSLLLTNLSTEQLVGLNGAAFADGFIVIAWEVGAALALVLMGLFFLPRFLKSGIATVPEFLEYRFGNLTRAITTIIFVVAYAVILLPIVLYTGATGLNSMLDIQELTGLDSRLQAIVLMVVVVAGIGSIYALVGGLGSVAISDTLNGLLLLIGGGMITWLGLNAVNDGGVWSGLQELTKSHPEKFESIGTAEQSVPFKTLFTGVLLLNLFYWCTNQQIIQRTFAARNLREGQKGVLLAGFLKVLTPIILVLPGVIAFHLFGSELETRDAAYGTLVQHVLPWYLTGFFAAVVIGAILSSFNSGLNSCATLFSLGIYRAMIRPDADDSEVIRMGKWFGWVVTVVSVIIAPLLVYAGGIFGYLQKMNGLYFIPIFSVVVVGMLGRSVPGMAANTALIVGCLVIAFGYFVPIGTNAETDSVTYLVPDFINEFHFLGVVFVALVGLMLLIGALRPLDQPWQQAHARKVDLTPWPGTKWASLGILFLVIAIYSVLAM